MIARLLCFIGIHLWVYAKGPGRPMHRSCERCGKAQGWDYHQARTRGRIVWTDDA